MSKVDLCKLKEPFLGLIVERASGVIYANEVGGIHCEYPEVEGVFIPLPVVWLPADDPLFDVWEQNFDGGMDVSRFLASSWPLSRHFEVREGFKSHEGYGQAWVPVKLKSAPDDALLSDFAGSLGILTYANSD